MKGIIIHSRSFISRLAWGILSIGLTVPVMYAEAAGGPLPPGSSGKPKLVNPIAATDLGALIKSLVNIIVQLAVPVAAVFIIYSGFLFVTAGGEEKKLDKAKETFFWTVIGTAIVLGAWVIVTVVTGTIKKLQ